MSFINLKQIIPKILININFEEYLIHQGFISVPEKNVGSFKCYVLDENKVFSDSEILFLSIYKEKENYYSITKKDQGTIIDFVKKRLDTNKEYTTFNPSTDSLIEACKILVLYINQYGENKEKNKNSTSILEIEEFKRVVFSKYFKLEKFTNSSFFKNFDISDDTSFHESFNSKIFNLKGLGVAYPLTDINNYQVGFFYNKQIELDKSKKEDSLFSDYTNKSGVWKSNEITLKTNERRYLTIVSNPKEALAHFEVSSNKTLIQYFTFFDVNPTSLKHLYQELKIQSSILYLCSNINIKDLTNELKILTYLMNFKYDMQIDDIDNLYINLRIKADTKNKKLYTPFIKKIFSYNKNHVLETTNILGSFSTEYLKNDLIEIKDIDTNKGETFIIKIPNSTKAIYNFIKIIADSFPLFFNICLEKPKYISWIKQNKFNNSTNNSNTNKLIEDELIFVHKTR
ncbi:hypothetical protein G1K75_11920 [Tenacibaculum finnmarkense]|uniref:hypothetical protein n=3 Tax=Tenacibaculum finnmarkense TaxID=2781243 RepID=UPI00187B4A98|nr:hypothetical protein [Tenacibaculum finnmarkense]MBE7634978.1 hypothetical protein [Tenacibaculum finnmarkense genomovar ulcerans]MCD8403793.1 hypothetical protein [Tenacibaculum finnmarkense genomovar finnmarkense]MCD8430891.1 hypothetical protein [Tenacibaculum finnmarkense genomovar ulcerans]MCD8433440.1 hypothetical protein [Tenacibaculum finnmarkense genomovar ulcerans]MCG8806357.1 hypothetical protein [Tenacibaculum finnmarkense]